MSDITIIGGIVHHNNGGYGFKLTFPSSELAQKYKEMIHFILRDDNLFIEEKKGYYDKKEK